MGAAIYTFTLHLKRFIMKRALIFLSCLAGLFPFFVNGQITKRTATTAKSLPVSASTLAGLWSGSQTDMTGLYPQAINFTLTGNGQFLMGNNQNGVYPVSGTFVISGNSISGTYKQASSGEIFSFTAIYDAATQKLSGTTGAGTAITGNSKWTVAKTAQTLALQPSATIKKTIPTTTTTAAPPPAAMPGNSVLGKWNAFFKYTSGQTVWNYRIEFDSKGKIELVDPRLNPDWESVVVGTGNYSFANNQVSGSFELKSNWNRFYYFTGTLDKNVVTGKYTVGYETIPAYEWHMTFVSPPPATSSNTNNSNYQWEIDRCEGTNSNDYYLVDVAVRFYTGNDNKEALSKVIGKLILPEGSRYATSTSNTSTQLFWNDDISERSAVEFKSNSAADLQLQTMYTPCTSAMPSYHALDVNLGTINTYGLNLEIIYSPNLFTDAWKINGVALLLLFTKPDGTLHPTLGNKIITFLNVAPLMTSSNNKLFLSVDKFLMPK